MTRVTTKGICEPALRKIGADTGEFYFYSMLRRVNARRQNEIADLMVACSDFSFSFLNVLVFASNARDFVRGKRRMRGLSRAELELIEEVILSLETAFWKAAQSYANDARALMVTEAYVRRILNNPELLATVRSRHPNVLRELGRLSLYRPERARPRSDPTAAGC